MASKMKRVLSWLGLFGTLVCVSGVLGTWYAERQVNSIRRQMFESVERSFARIEKGIGSVERVLHDSQVTVEKIKQRLKDWKLDETDENLKAKLQLETRAEQLAGRLDQAEALLSGFNSTVEHVTQLLALGEKAGLPIHAELVEGLSKRISTLQSKIAVARQTAKSLRRLVAGGNNDTGESKDTRLERVGKLAVTMTATFTQLNERISRFAARATETRETISRLNARVHSRILGVAVLATLFFLWMAMGQICLWRQM